MRYRAVAPRAPLALFTSRRAGEAGGVWCACAGPAPRGVQVRREEEPLPRYPLG